jgi:hypothetical protein
MVDDPGETQFSGNGTESHDPAVSSFPLSQHRWIAALSAFSTSSASSVRGWCSLRSSRLRMGALVLNCRVRFTFSCNTASLRARCRWRCSSRKAARTRRSRLRSRSARTPLDITPNMFSPSSGFIPAAKPGPRSATGERCWGMDDRHGGLGGVAAGARVLRGRGGVGSAAKAIYISSSKAVNGGTLVSQKPASPPS